MLYLLNYSLNRQFKFKIKNMWDKEVNEEKK